MESEFKEFLFYVERMNTEVTKLIVHKSQADTCAAEYITCNQNASKILLERMRDISSAFYKQAESIKLSLESFLNANPSVKADEKRFQHIKSISKNLSIHIDRFSKTKEHFTKIVAEKDLALRDICTDANEVICKKQNPSNRSHILPFSSPLESTDPSMESHQKLYAMLISLQDLEMMNIELSTVIESAGTRIDRVSISTTETKNSAQNINASLESGITQRKRRRKMKKIFITLLIIIIGLICVFLGTKILDFLFKFKETFLK
ncbi:hypothetical protein NEFER03_1127 [Nematocida sp. LUAm3]|nr:hypothetical protein NEFER03_1127 [Nematocida sp. LUAm3]KAI5176337.1 hypothetical protein NEFER02_2125 [Nematocida sp. LUAm2]KAI5178232.1 hypothetical protein NEFER01_1399 [Nematocida sp. LUAm1]